MQEVPQTCDDSISTAGKNGKHRSAIGKINMLCGCQQNGERNSENTHYGGGGSGIKCD